MRDLPLGWLVENTDDSGNSGNSGDSANSGNSGDSGCNLTQPNAKQFKFKAHAGFRRGNTALVEGLAYLGSPSRASGTYTTLANALDSCHSGNGTDQPWTIAKVPLGRTFGNRSDAWQTTGNADGQTVGIEIVFGQSNSTLFVVLYMELGNPSTATVSHYTTLAYDKLTGHPTSGVNDNWSGSGSSGSSGTGDSGTSGTSGSGSSGTGDSGTTGTSGSGGIDNSPGVQLSAADG